MIVKNESHVILRCLESVRPLVDYVLIEDTGSTDGTQGIVRDWLDRVGLPGEVVEEPWRDFAYNRSHALARLRQNKAIAYALMLDADDQLVPEPGFDVAAFKQGLSRDFYMVPMRNGALLFTRGQICSNRREFRYRGVLHEFLVPPPGKVSSGTTSGFHISVSREGARGQDPDKYRKDAALLERALAKEKDAFLRTRYTFYLARSYHHAGNNAAALKAYMKRTKMGGWAEEVFISHYSAGKLQEALGRPFDEVIATYRRASTAAPKRAEALHAASKLCRENKKWTEGYQYAVRGLRIPMPAEGLFVESWIYDYGLLDELAVNAYWTERYQECLDACRRLLDEGKLPEDQRDRVKKNGEFAAEKIGFASNPLPPLEEQSTVALASPTDPVSLEKTVATDAVLQERNRPRWCVFTSAGDFHNILSWTDDKDQERQWDLIVAFYGESEAEFQSLSSVSTILFKSKGSKWQNLKKFYEHDKGVFTQYDFVLVADDDLVWQTKEDIVRLFETADQYDFWICQPAFSEKGRISHSITVSHGDKSRIRFVNFVEVTCPIFRSDKLNRFLEIYDGELVGWGIDWWYCNVFRANFFRKFAIIDEIIAINPHDYQRRGGTREIIKLQSDSERRAHWFDVMQRYNLHQYVRTTFFSVKADG